MGIELDDLDKNIINMLIENCNRSVRDIAKAVGKSPSLILKRVKRLYEAGLIKRCEASIDYSKLGYDLMALILFKVDGAHIEDVEQELAKEPRVRGVYDITGEFDIAVLALFKNVNDLNSFIKRVLKNPYIKESVTSIIFKAVKDEKNIEYFK
ncbi:Lrp/AsnC family transcriptional regulator [Ignisphaera sp. 4213-co]|uniref:Lrp/AsnC family transcriptional regulator n=1 Tax=Ignisphaera cupida TaxID=3050454 RepID=A0ABD4Z8F7_9CREN|nr:Lrp/AsnC family transcriptional regulator [Ignisphaera sp. 4213-co]MDK6028388.1 Lrp/AsnC family transcriptional regulator [Ignisphaera sp. 4213-co]